MGMLMVMPAIIQPAFLQDIIKVAPDFFGSINGFLQNMSQIATLAFVAMVGVLSDKVGRKILAVIGFFSLIFSYYAFGQSVAIAEWLNISEGFSSNFLCLLELCSVQSVREEKRRNKKKN